MIDALRQFGETAWRGYVWTLGVWGVWVLVFLLVFVLTIIVIGFWRDY